MATLEQILEEAKKLPPEEQRRLRAALAELGPMAIRSRLTEPTNKNEPGLMPTVSSTSTSGSRLMVIAVGAR